MAGPSSSERQSGISRRSFLKTAAAATAATALEAFLPGCAPAPKTTPTPPAPEISYYPMRPFDLNCGLTALGLGLSALFLKKKIDARRHPIPQAEEPPPLEDPPPHPLPLEVQERLNQMRK